MSHQETHSEHDHHGHDHHGHDHEHGHHHADDGGVHVHVHPVSLYLKIFFALVFLTIITVFTAKFVDIDGFIVPGTLQGTGGFNLALAMMIAAVKATLVCTWFMHLKDDNKFNAIFFAGSVVFVGVFLVYTMNDTSYRGRDGGDPYQGVTRHPRTGAHAPGAYGLLNHMQITAPCRFSGSMPADGVPADAPVCFGHVEHIEHHEGGHEEAAQAEH